MERKFDKKELWITWVGIVLLWMGTHPYVGIVWDAEYYTVQALHFLTPERYADDLFFAYGSQDQFTLFSRIYGPLIAGLGLDKANLVLILIGQGLWLGGVTYLVLGMVGRAELFSAVAGVILLPGSSAMVFHYAEPILTPRIFAEALTLWAMGDLWRGHQLRSLGLLMLGLLVHPLMVLAGLAVWFLWGPGQRLLGWIGFLSLLIVVFGLAVADIQPFVRLLQTFDPIWWTIVRQRTSYAFIGLWDIANWPAVLYTVVLAFWVMQKQGKRVRKFVGLALLVGMGGILVSALGGDLLRNVLVIDAQLWRGLWLASVMIHMGVAHRYLVLWRHVTWRSHALYWWTMALFIGVLAAWHGGFFLLAFPMSLIAILVEFWESRERSVTFVVMGIEVILVGVLIKTFLTFVRVLLQDESMIRHWMNVFPEWFMMGIVFFWVGVSKRKVVSNHALWLVPLFLLVFALLNWDQRAEWVRYVDRTSTAPAELVALLPKHRAIYWEGDLTVPWFLLRRANYFSCSQGTGSMFSRETALRYQHLYSEFQRLDTEAFLPGTYCAPASGPFVYPPEKSQILAVCQANSKLGALVLLHPVAGMVHSVWEAPATFSYDQSVGSERRRFSTRRFYVVRCPD